MTLVVAVTALATVLVAVPATLALDGAFTPTPRFDQRALEDGVRGVLNDDFALTDVRAVDCPPNIEVKPGLEFECAFTSAGAQVTVPVEVLNDAGQYRVGGPAADSDPAQEPDPGSD